ncbi:lytic transglycosylase domain-containing protein [Luteimonas sp. RD2P54]|uniref:Lytic transglycosylase domain-containing protein n=1 Tax=Luteimonas endophytica TaxID=3042023 RepID=A0ABT6JAI9_9GAMM|nr:lytic transglycosylase domain-containing protein [Luteimonas endophytica]MDH5823847.1 lytic transglycosylase domain-containing protein [Luteimonas endophytica]
MKGAWGSIVVLTCALASVPAAAGTLYRCDSGDGVPQYVSRRVAGASCTVISSYRPEPARPRRAAAPAAAGKVTASSRVEGSPATLDANAPATFMGQGAAATTPTRAPATPAARPRTRHVQGQVYSYIKDGVRHYTSRAPRGVAGASAVRTIRYSFMETCYACGASPGVSFGTVRLNTDAYRDEIRAAAQRFGVEEAVVRAIIHAESAFNPNALSRVGAQGLMQLMPATAQRFGVGNPFDPGQNILGGVEYLAWLLKRFNGDLTLAAAGYNAGEGAVDRHGGVPPYSETRRYVERVGVLAERYRGYLASNTAP